MPECRKTEMPGKERSERDRVLKRKDSHRKMKEFGHFPEGKGVNRPFCSPRPGTAN